MASNTAAPVADEIPVIQVLEKERYFTQALISLPSALPYPTLTPSSIRLRPKVLAITSNSFTYAKVGFLGGYWDVHLLPSSTPAPYNDATIYGCISTWGWAEVLDSTHASVPPGALLWGYQPFGTLAQDLTVEIDSDVPGHINITSPHRQHMPPLYNHYIKATDTAALRGEIANRAIGPAYDALARVMFETAHLINRYVLARDTAVPPSARPAAEPWTPDSADITGATILAAAPASKVGLCFAHQIRYARGEKDFGGQRPARIVGVASEQSRAFAEQSGLYDAVVSADDSPLESLTKLGVAQGDKVVLMDFGGRGQTGLKWATAIDPVYEKFLMLTVGFDISEVSPTELVSARQAAGSLATSVNANDIRHQAIKLSGAATYHEDLERGWELIRKDGFKGQKICWGSGMENVKTAWEKFTKGDVPSDEGMVVIV